jgi:TetR/AcrR family transcriptional repressor of nem operon
MAGRTDTRRQILEVAGKLMMERGYNGFSYKDIAEPLGIKNAAIHYHFPAKEDLGVAWIDEYRKTMRRRTVDFMAKGENPDGQLEGYIRYVTESLQSHWLCPLGIVGVDFYTLPPRMKKHAQLLVDEMIAWLTRVLDLGRREGVYEFSGSPRAKAMAVKSCLQGAAQLARIAGGDVLDEAAEQVRRDLRWI